MSDKELLEMAAKAAGMKLGNWHGSGYWVDTRDSAYGSCARSFNSLTDPGDCARLEDALGIEIAWGEKSVYCCPRNTAIEVREFHADHGGDKGKARRYASTRAAAAIATEKGQGA